MLAPALLPELPRRGDWDANPGPGRRVDAVGEFYFLHRCVCVWQNDVGHGRTYKGMYLMDWQEMCPKAALLHTSHSALCCMWLHAATIEWPDRRATLA